MYVFSAHDAGPAKYLSDLYPFVEEEVKVFSSACSKAIFDRHNIDSSTHWSLLDCDEVSLVVTGTSIGETIDKTLTRWASEFGIVSVSIIDHWSHYLGRFEGDGFWEFPDWIIVNDEFAYEGARLQGVPEEKLIIGGHPVLDSIFSETCESRSSRKILREKLRLPEKKIFVFISEEIQSIFSGTENDPGYDEFQVLRDIVSVLTDADHLLIKKHPEEAPEKYQEWLCHNISLIDYLSLSELNIIADVVVGMESILLIELAVLREDVISYRPGGKREFYGDIVQATVPAHSLGQFRRVIRNSSRGRGTFGRAFSGSRKKIGQILSVIAKNEDCGNYSS